MLACKCLIFLCSGCYGSKSCTPDGRQCNYLSNDSCPCDCCPPCNTCEQFFQFNCLSHRYLRHYSLSTNQSELIAKINESITRNYIMDQTNGELARYLWHSCLRRLLPRDIYLINDSQGRYKLLGTGREKLEKTHYEILFKGPVSLVLP